MIQEFSALPAEAATAIGLAVFRNSSGEAEISTDPAAEAPEGVADTTAAAAGESIRIVTFGEAIGVAGEAITAADWNKFVVAGTGGKLLLLDAANFTTEGNEVVYTLGRVRGTASGDGVPLKVFVNPTPINFYTAPA